MNTSLRKFKSEAGFTLLELMIVISIIGILAVYTVPRYQAVKEQYRLEASAQSVSAALRYAKQLSMDQRITAYVCLTESEVQVLKKSGSNYDVVDSKSFDTGVKFDSSKSIHSWLSNIEDPTKGILGKGVTYTYQGFNQSNGIIELANSTGRTVQVGIADKTGHITILWP